MGRRPPGLERDKGYMTDYALSSGPVLSAFVMKEDGLAVHAEPCSAHNDNSHIQTHPHTHRQMCLHTVYCTEPIKTYKQISLQIQIPALPNQSFSQKWHQADTQDNYQVQQSGSNCGEDARESVMKISESIMQTFGIGFEKD